MQALQATDRTSGLRLAQTPIPELGPDEVLVKVSAAGVTPGVLRLLQQGRARTPTIVGHEIAGTIAGVGEQVPSEFAEGSRVRVHPILSCRQCSYCTSGRDQMCEEGAIMGFAQFGQSSPLYEKYHDGGVAEYAKAPYWLVDTLPENVSFEVAAKVHDVATALHAFERANLPRDSVLLLTAPTGAMGVLSLRLAQEFRVKKVILVGRARERLEAVRSLTPVETAVVVSSDAEGELEQADLLQKVREAAPEGVDGIIDYIPTGGLVGKIIPVLNTGGVLVHVGANMSPLPVPLMVVMAKCWTIVGSRAHTRENTKTVLRWLREDRFTIDDLITHRFRMSEVEGAIEKIESRREAMWLSVIDVSL